MAKSFFDPLGLFSSSNAAAPIQSLPVPTPSPPVTAANAQVVASETSFAKSQLAKKTFGDTVKAGDTGGFQAGQPGYPGGPTIGPTTYKK